MMISAMLHAQEEAKIYDGLTIEMVNQRVEKSLSNALKDDVSEEAAVRATLSSGDSDELWAVFQLWKWGKMDAVSKQWWKSSDRINRVVILMALSMEIKSEDIIDVFRAERLLESERYALPEAKLRMQEVNFALAHRKDDAFRKNVVKVFK